MAAQRRRDSQINCHPRRKKESLRRSLRSPSARTPHSRRDDGQTERRNLRRCRMRGPAAQNAEKPAGAIPPRASRGAIEKRPPRARRPALPQPRAAVLSAKAGLTAGFGMGPGDPRLCGRARGGRSPAASLWSLPGPLAGATLAAAWRARKKIAHRARCFNRGCEELGLLVPLG